MIIQNILKFPLFKQGFNLKILTEKIQSTFHEMLQEFDPLINLIRLFMKYLDIKIQLMTYLLSHIFLATYINKTVYIH